MNYQFCLTVCTILLKTIASNNSNYFGDIYNLEMPSILLFSYAFGEKFGVKGLNIYLSVFNFNIRQR